MKKFILLLCTLYAIIFSFAKADQKIRTVTVWTFLPNNYEEWKKRKNDIDKKFSIDLQLELVSINAFTQKLQAVMMGGEDVPDIIEWMIENNRILLSDPARSFVIPLNKYITKSGLDKKVLRSRLSWLTYSENIYGLPHDAHPVVLIYNDTVWKRAGVDISKVETWDEFFEKAKKLNKLKKNGKQVHFALPSGNGGLGDSMFLIWQQTEAQIVTKDGKPNFNSPEFIEFIRKWEKWTKTGTMTNWDWGNFSNLIADGTYASYISPDWWVSQSDFAAKNKKYNLKMRILPLYKKGMKYGSSWGGSFLAIPKGTKDPDKIFKIMEYIQYDETSVIERYKETEMIPPLHKIWNHNAFNKKDKRFGNKKTAQIQIKSANILPNILVTDNFWNYIGDFNEEYEVYLSKKNISFETMIDNAQERAMRRFNSENNSYIKGTSDIANDEENEEEPEEIIEEDVYDE